MAERVDNRTEQELILEAIQVQDACNLSGVVFSFARAMERLCVIGREKNQSSEWRNKHRVCRLFASKIQSLSGDIGMYDFDLINLDNC